MTTLVATGARPGAGMKRGERCWKSRGGRPGRAAPSRTRARNYAS
jgi:hypothetical protein